MKTRYIVILFLSLFITACSDMKEKVDLIVFNGHIYTVDEGFSVFSAMAVKDGKIYDLGLSKDILKRYNADQMLDVDGKAIFPGFNDGHCHFNGLGENLYRYADLKGSKSFEEVIERLEHHIAQHPADFILGRGWDQNLWDPPVFPDNELLEHSFPAQKILLIRVDGHASLASKAALEIAGIKASTRVEGGEVVLNNEGQPTGLLIDKADIPVRTHIQPLTVTERHSALLEAQNRCFELGLTSVTDAGLPYQTIELIRNMQNNNELKMKINAMLDPTEETLDYYLAAGPQFSDLLSISSIKLYSDGALGSRGAWMLEPYSDEPTKTGFRMEEDVFYRDIIQRAYDAGFQVNTHAIGDAGVRYILDLYAEILPENNDRRWRIEHAQIVHPNDFPKFGTYNIIPSIQSTHATSDMLWAIDRVGEERLRGAYAQQQLLEQNGWLVNGTDFPIEGINPLETFYAAVARKNIEGIPAEGFQMENALSREQALRSITIWPAKGSYEENSKGSLEKGKAADFVILDHDIMECEIEQVRDTKVLVVYSNGEKVYRKE